MYNTAVEGAIDDQFPDGNTPGSGTESNMDSRVLAFYTHLQAGRMAETEATLLGLIAHYPDDVALANMLPGLLATAVPRILGDGSRQFVHADGTPLGFGALYSPPEYTMVYLELLLHSKLLGNPPIPTGSHVYRTISVMWEIMLDVIPANRKPEALKRFNSYNPLPDNVVRFRPNTTKTN